VPKPFVINHFKNIVFLLNKLFFKRPISALNQGYGLALLMVFLASSVLLATSMSLILNSSVVSYITSQSSTPIKGSQVQIGNAALDAAKNDILSNLGQGNTIDTSYRYPASGSNSITAPTYPGSGSISTIGSYYVTITKARGFTYILQATVTVNGMTQVISRLFQLSASAPCIINNAYFSYSLRKICTSYTGKAVKVRRSSDNTTQDIGFVGSDLDVASLRTFLGEDLPLNADSSAKAAYALRKLKDSYAGKAIKVRCSSCTPTTLDVGFNTFGNLDTKALLAYVGNGSGYIDTWYDQSGQGLNLTQVTTANQPRIVNAGVLDTKNGIPAVYFGGSQSISNNAVSGKISGSEIRSFIVADGEPGSNTYGVFATLYKTGDSSDDTTSTSGKLLSLDNYMTRAAAKFNSVWTNWFAPTAGVLFQATTYHDASNNLQMWSSSVSSGATVTASSNLAPTQIILGTGGGTNSSVYITGYISELVVYNSAVTAANQTKIEKNQDHYYKIANSGTSSFTDGFVATWYDQTGNGYDLTQATTTAQPVIDLSGSAPALFFDSRLCQTNGSTTCEYLANSTLSQTLSPMKITALGVGQITANSATSWSGRMLSIYKTGTSDDRNASSALLLNYYSTNPITLGSKKDNDSSLNVSNTWGQDFQATSVADGTNRSFRAYQTSTGLVTGTTTSMASESLVMNNIRVGINNALDNNAFWDGRINEILFYTTALPVSTYQTYEMNQRTYYGL
jgi:hypothetical protein